MKTIFLFCLVFLFLPQSVTIDLNEQDVKQIAVGNTAQEASRQTYQIYDLSAQETQNSTAQEKESEAAKQAIRVTVLDFLQRIGLH